MTEVRDNVQARSFTLVDDDGRELAALDGRDGFPVLRLRDASGALRLVAQVDEDGNPVVSLAAPDGTPCAFVAVVGSDAVIATQAGSGGVRSGLTADGRSGEAGLQIGPPGVGSGEYVRLSGSPELGGGFWILDADGRPLGPDDAEADKEVEEGALM